MIRGNPATRALPFVALGCSAAYLLTFAFAPALLALAVGATLACAGVALTRRASRTFTVVVVGIGFWLAIGLGGAWLLRHRPLLGLGWTLGVLFLLPLPLVPWLYAITFPRDTDNDETATGHGGRS